MTSPSASEQRKLPATADAHPDGRGQRRLRQQLHAAPVARPLGDDVDEAEHGVRAVHHRAGPHDDLDVVDELDRDARPDAEVGAAADLLVDGVAVEQQQEVAAPIARDEDAARADLAAVQVVGAGDAQRQEVDGLSERLDAVAPQVLARDDGRQRRSRAGPLGLLGDRADHLLAEQAFEVRDVVGARGARGERGQHRRRQREQRAAGSTELTWDARARACGEPRARRPGGQPGRRPPASIRAARSETRCRRPRRSRPCCRRPAREPPRARRRAPHHGRRWRCSRDASRFRRRTARPPGRRDSRAAARASRARAAMASQSTPGPSSPMDTTTRWPSRRTLSLTSARGGFACGLRAWRRSRRRGRRCCGRRGRRPTRSRPTWPAASAGWWARRSRRRERGRGGSPARGSAR